MPLPPVSLLLIVFLASLGLDWPELPMGARLPDLLFLCVLAAAALGPRPRLAWHRLDLLVALYLAGSLPSFATTPSVTASATELVRQVYLVVVYAAVAGAVAGGHTRVVAMGLACSGAAPAVVGLAFLLAQAVTGLNLPAAGAVMSLPYLGDVLRLRAFASSQSMLACVLAMAVPFALGLAARGASARDRAAWAVAAAAIVVAAPFTFSHSIAGVAVAVVLGAWPYVAAYPRWRLVAAAGAVLVVLVFNVAAIASIRRVAVAGRSLSDDTSYHHGVGDERVQVPGMTVDYSVMSYFRLKQVAWAAFAAQPLTGVGLDRFHDVSERAFADGRLTAAYRVIDPHSTLPGRLAETGLVGGLTLVLLWAGVAAAAVGAAQRGGPDQWIVVAVVAGFTALLVNSVNVDIMNFRFVWAALGLLRGILARSDA